MVTPLHGMLGISRTSESWTRRQNFRVVLQDASECDKWIRERMWVITKKKKGAWQYCIKLHVRGTSFCRWEITLSVTIRRLSQWYSKVKIFNRVLSFYKLGKMDKVLERHELLKLMSKEVKSLKYIKELEF